MKKSMLKIALSVLLVAVVLVGGTLAYLVTQTDILTNTFSVVKIDTGIEENTENDAAESKSPTVINRSNVPVYVRAMAVVVTEEGSSVPVSADDVEIHYAAVDPEDTDAGWVYNETDQYYYYTQPVEAGASTGPLFNGVGVDISGEDAEGAKFAVYVYHESVEAKELTFDPDATAADKAAAIAALFQ